jgi:lysophospholipase L1-like esterase
MAQRASQFGQEVTVQQEAVRAPDMLRPLPAHAKVLIVGDSFTQGFGATDQKKDSYAKLLVDANGWDARIDGVGGSGYFWGGGKDGHGGMRFVERLAEHAADPDFVPDLVIFQGSSNDYRANLYQMIDAVYLTVDETRRLWPDAQIAMIGPSLAYPNGENLREMNGALSRAADNRDVPFIDALNARWLNSTNSPGYAFTDGSHLTTPGHAFLASKVKEALDAKTAKP